MEQLAPKKVIGWSPAKSEWTPFKAIRRQSSRKILLMLVWGEYSPSEITRELKLSKRSTAYALSGLRKIGFVERLEEKGTRPAYRISELALNKLTEKRLLKVKQ